MEWMHAGVDLDLVDLPVVIKACDGGSTRIFLTLKQFSSIQIYFTCNW